VIVAPDCKNPGGTKGHHSQPTGDQMRRRHTGPGRSALLEARRQQRRTWLPWSFGFVVAVGFVAGVATDRAAPSAATLAVGVLALVLLLSFGPTAARARAVAATWRQGGEGELATGLLLRRLRRRGWHVFHDLQVPPSPRSRRRSNANIDHLLVGPGGVFVVDSKNYQSRVYWVDETGWCNKGRSIEPRLEATRYEARRVQQLLADLLGDPAAEPDDVELGDGETTQVEEPLAPHLARLNAPPGSNRPAGAVASAEATADDEEEEEEGKEEDLELVEVQPVWCVHGVDVLPTRELWADDVLLVTAPSLRRTLRRWPRVLSPARIEEVAQAVEERLSPAR
jgi:Nuclease-related domain